MRQRIRGGRLVLQALICAAFFVAASAGAQKNDSGDPPIALQRFALVIGANDGGAGRARLRYAGSDARSISGVLARLGGVRPQDETLLLEPTAGTLTAAFFQLAARVSEARGEKEPNRRIELLFYYSGHSDENGLLLGNERLTYGALRTAIENVAADVTIAILDSCSAGAFTRQKGGVQRPPFLVDTSVRVSGHAFLASSSANEAAQESDRIGSSFFTYYLLSGLRGAADISGDGRVTLNEAYNFAFNETLARTEKTLSGAQHPAYDIQLVGTGDVVMTDLRDPSARLELQKELNGRIYVRATSGVLYAELTKHSGTPVVLALEPGSYRITVERDGRFYQTQLDIYPGRTTPLAPTLLSQVAGERTVLRGGDVVEEEEPAARWVPVNISIIPTLSINRFFGKRVINAFSFHILSGVAAKLRGVELAVASNWRTEDAIGLQFAGGLNVVRDRMIGVQLTMGVNIVGGDALGIQFAGITNIVRGKSVGLSMSSALNLFGGDSWGFHLAGMDIVNGRFHGAQLSGLTSFARDMTGFQLSMGIAQSGFVRGVQFAIINIGGDVTGAQIGFLNIARNVSGAQIGFINIAENVEGAAIGFISAIKNGTHTLEIYGSDLMPFNLGAKLGSKRAYGIISFGIDPFKEQIRWSGGAGLGIHIPLFRNFFLDTDLITQSMQPDIRVLDSTYYHVQSELRLLFGWQALKRLAIFLGPSVHVSATNDPCCNGSVSLLDGGERLWQSGSTAVRLGPGLAAGLRAF